MLIPVLWRCCGNAVRHYVLYDAVRGTSSVLCDAVRKSAKRTYRKLSSKCQGKVLKREAT
jgi:hypothetical protein